MKWLLLVLVVAFSYVCTHPVQREHEHGDHDHPDHHLAKRNTDQNAERDEESPASEEAEGDGDPVNNEVDVEEAGEEGTCDEKNTDEESNTDETKAPKKLSLKDLQSNHKGATATIHWTGTEALVKSAHTAKFTITRSTCEADAQRRARINPKAIHCIISIHQSTWTVNVETSAIMSAIIHSCLMKVRIRNIWLK
ncbi:unnamed protein product [Nippostrongylus brasiliensis]|uniref:Secretory peptide n=1 Tax=Nippostrongylus brasiliensis TaxID=27835 RepID=A0A0N4Y963_NIPBR|nr:unnamed protein product [Nippostrongylus brasiliensis]